MGIMGDKKLEFYGGPWVSFLPMIVFLISIITTTFVFKSISDGALWLPAFIALIVAFFFAKNKKEFSRTIIDGMSSKQAIIPIVCWIFAGVFSRILRESGLAHSIASMSASLGVSQNVFLIITFLASALFAFASGTGFGTIAAGMGVLYPAGVALGVYPPLLAGAIISGGAFGDNLAPVSDTTICSATSQGVDVPGVVRSRIKYVIPSLLITVVIFTILSFMYVGVESEGTIVDVTYKGLIMLIPVALTIYIAIKSGDIIIATSYGIVLSAITAIAIGNLDFIQIDQANPSVEALFRVSGAGLDRTVDGVIFTGISSMMGVSILALLLFGSIALMVEGGGDEILMNTLSKVARGVKSAELTIFGMIFSLSAVMGLNAPAILTVGSSFAKPLSEKFGISPYRTANLLDATSCTLVYSLPFTPVLLYTVGFTSGTSAELSATEITPFVVYAFVLLAVMFLSILTGYGSETVKPKQKDLA